MSDEKTTASKKKRGFFLTIWLVFMLLGFLFSGILLLVGGSLITYLLKFMMPNMEFAGWIAIAFALLQLVGFVLTIFIFAWRKWAVYIVLGVAGVMSLLSLIFGFSLQTIIGIILGPGLLAFFIFKKWQFFK